MVLLLSSVLASYVAASAILVDRDLNIYGEGQDVAIDAPGVAYHPAYKGFPSEGEGPRQSHGLQALIANYIHPGWVPPGINPVHCTPQDGRLPVVLIPATTATVYMNWAYIGPELVDEGLCVYSFTHNPLVNPLTGSVIKGTGFMGNITESAYALSNFIDQVLALTGSEKVDMVGHSQGAGALPFYYMKNIMQGEKVRKHIGIAPSLGTEAYGLNRLISHILTHQQEDSLNEVLAAAENAESLMQQLRSSPWMEALYQGGLAVDNVEYFNIATIYDEVLVPWTNCHFNEAGKNITNILLQNECALDFSDHLGLAYSKNVLAIVKNSLLDRHDPIQCQFSPLLPL